MWGSCDAGALALALTFSSLAVRCLAMPWVSGKKNFFSLVIKWGPLTCGGLFHRAVSTPKSGPEKVHLLAVLETDFILKQEGHAVAGNRRAMQDTCIYIESLHRLLGQRSK